jgi:glyoxylase-like metal-dependent hydrolase (beta-lactamase superfamily II)/ferredoxin
MSAVASRIRSSNFTGCSHHHRRQSVGHARIAGRPILPYGNGLYPQPAFHRAGLCSPRPGPTRDIPCHHGSMASLSRRLAANAPGGFFVDSTCIDCDTCRQLAPEVFGDTGEFAYVRAQPSGAQSLRNAVRALLACPTGSIGTDQPSLAAEVKQDFPLSLEPGLFYCGFNSRKSYGGNSYFLATSQGNWLVDAPRFNGHLVRCFEKLGGIDYIFLTHRDDVAGAAQHAARFGSRRVIHRSELQAQPDAEIVLDAEAPFDLLPNFTVIPTPGHTRGHCCLLYAGRLLFTGDHLWWSREQNCLSAGRDVCWYSWELQRRSMAALLDFSFEWVLPGHGQRVKLPAGRMHSALRALVSRMHRM